MLGQKNPSLLNLVEKEVLNRKMSKINDAEWWDFDDIDFEQQMTGAVDNLNAGQVDVSELEAPGLPSRWKRFTDLASGNIEKARQKTNAMPPFSRRVYVDTKPATHDLLGKKRVEENTILLASEYFLGYQEQIKRLKNIIFYERREMNLKNLNDSDHPPDPTYLACLHSHLQSGTEPLVLVVNENFDFDPSIGTHKFYYKGIRLPFEKFTPHESELFGRRTVYLKWHGWYEKLNALGEFSFKPTGYLQKAYKRIIALLLKRQEYLDEKYEIAIFQRVESVKAAKQVDGAKDPILKFKLRQEAEKFIEAERQARTKKQDFENKTLRWVDRWIYNTSTSREKSSAAAKAWLVSAIKLVPDISRHLSSKPKAEKITLP